MITRRIPFILFVSVLALLGACAQTPRLPSVESPSDQARISQARESYRQAIEANPEALGPFAAYCRALPEMTDRRISELRGQLEGTRDVVRIKPMIETLVATHKELEADNAWLTAHCRCKQEDFNQALVGFREHARENEALIVSSEALARKHLSEQTKLSNGFAERARQFLLAKRIEDAQENAGHALEFNSENALARGVRDLVERFEKGRSLILTGHLQSGEPMLQEVQKSGFLAAESQTYLNDARGKRQRLAQIIVQADTMLRGKRLPEAVALLKSAIGIDKDQDAAITGRVEAVEKLPAVMNARAKKDYATATRLLGEAQALWADSAALGVLAVQINKEAAQAQAVAALEQAQKDLAAGEYRALAADLAQVYSLAATDKVLKARANAVREDGRKRLIKEATGAEKAKDDAAAWRAYERCVLLAGDALCTKKEALLRATLSASYAGKNQEAVGRGDWAQALLYAGLARQLAPNDAAASQAFTTALAAARQAMTLPVSIVALFSQATDLERIKGVLGKELAPLPLRFAEAKEARYILAYAQAPKPQSEAELQGWLKDGQFPASPTPPPLGELWLLSDAAQTPLANSWNATGEAPALSGLKAPLLAAQDALAKEASLAGKLRSALADPAAEGPGDWFVFLPLLAAKGP